MRPRGRRRDDGEGGKKQERKLERKKQPWGRRNHEQVAMMADLMERKLPRKEQLWQVTECAAGK